jgi:hypothetical protein
MNKGKMVALKEHRKKQTQAKDARRAERASAKTTTKK